MNFQLTCKNIVHRGGLLFYKSKSYLPPEQKKSNYTTNINISDLITGCPTSNLFYIFQLAITQKLCDLDTLLVKPNCV